MEANGALADTPDPSTSAKFSSGEKHETSAKGRGCKAGLEYTTFCFFFGGGGCAIKAERVCWLVLPGVPTCAPFEEGILHSWIGGLIGHPLRWGMKKEGSERLREVGRQLGHVTPMGGGGA